MERFNPQKIQELAVMPEAAQIAGLGQNGQRVRWPDARHGHETPAIGIIPQHDGSLLGDMLAEPMQTQILSEDEAGLSSGTGTPIDRLAAA